MKHGESACGRFVAKFCSFERARLIRGQAPMRNVDFKNPSAPSRLLHIFILQLLHGDFNRHEAAVATPIGKVRLLRCSGPVGAWPRSAGSDPEQASALPLLQSRSSTAPRGRRGTCFESILLVHSTPIGGPDCRDSRHCSSAGWRGGSQFQLLLHSYFFSTAVAIILSPIDCARRLTSALARGSRRALFPGRRSSSAWQ